MENTNNYSNTTPKPIGEWKIGDDDYFISFALTEKPNWFRRLMANLFFGLRWIDYPQPKDVRDIQAGKGVRAAMTKVIPPQKGRHRR